MIPGDDRDILSAGAPDEPSGDHVRRRRRWQAVTAVVAAAAIVVGIVAAEHPGRSHPAPPRVTAVGSPAPLAALPAPAAAPGTVLASCDAANVGQVAAANLPSDWRRWSAGAGPLWFANIGGQQQLSVTGKTATARPEPVRPVLYVVVVVITGIEPGTSVVVRTTPAGRRYLRFLYGPGDSMNAGTVYTMSSGESGVTFPMCPPGPGNAGTGPITDYYGGLLIAAGRCIPVDVWPPRHTRPTTVRLGACH